MDADQQGTLLDTVLELIGDDSPALANLARAYLLRLPFGTEMEPRSAYEEIRGLYEFILERPGPIDVRVFNPDPDLHGYTAPGTVVEIHTTDTPFLVDSVTAELQAHGAEVASVLHPVIRAVRDDEGRLVSVHKATDDGPRESVQHYVLARRLDESEFTELDAHLRQVLGDVLSAVRDFDDMAAATKDMKEAVTAAAGHYPEDVIAEAVEFLDWLTDDNFVFLGYREYRIVDTEKGPGLVVDPSTGLGILDDPEASRTRRPVPLADLPEEVVNRYRQGGLLVISKTNRLSTVHRRARMDYVGVRTLSPDGETVGELRLVGLFTSKAYMESVTRIPILRKKLAEVADSEDLVEGSHDHKAVVALVESFPKDELFGLPTEDLRRVVLGLLALQERARVRLFVRRDILDRGVRILVAMPRDRYSAGLRMQLQALFLERFQGVSVDYHLSLDRSDIARLHFTVWVPEGLAPEVAFEQLDSEVLNLTRSWGERVADLIAQGRGATVAQHMVQRWEPLLPDYYKASTQISVAAGDIQNLERLTTSAETNLVGLQNEEEEGPDVLTRVTLYETGGKRPLSDLTPALEDMGLVVVEEVPTRVEGDEETFMHDFGVLDSSGAMLDLDAHRDRVAAALQAIWRGEAETDSLNRLLLVAGLDHEQVAVLRGYQTYWRRVSPIFTVNYMHDALVAHAHIAAGLMHLFALRFSPEPPEGDYETQRELLLEQLDAVPSLDQDRILRGFLRLIDATLRTNAYQADRAVLSLKLRSGDVPDMPEPRPHVEMFVIGPTVEGVHLRAGSRARGGIRWSERKEDYRTEVLGLMKAQVTKNAIIVPTGAKGGFVLRSGAEESPAGVARAYEDYIAGLLDITDNLVDGKVVSPDRVRVHDEDDPYLVVAADRGTARLSDTANRLAAEHGFWLDDAFASGGATGYDHKALGITARGAWKSLEHHFLELGIDPQTDRFKVVGIGDMSGDVFGNGMLQTRSMRLVAAFDHRHIFLDPEPDPELSFQERERLFNLPRSSWDDYDRQVISAGGGVYSRAAKKIEISAEAREVLGTDESTFTPVELIRTVLRAPVDLIWNGGIGTYVRASTETDEEVGDRANDSVRVEAQSLRSRVVVEGGNLGFTQRGRIEYAQTGGLINADFIDNSAGVNCSDREVNLKILLRLAEERGRLDREGRDALLAESAVEVVRGILDDNMAQAHRLALDESESAGHMDAYDDLVADLEEAGYIDRHLDDLPSPREMRERARSRRGLTRPELAVILSQTKHWLSAEITASSLPDAEDLVDDLAAYFPSPVVERFGGLLWDHPLRRELIATIVANDIVNSQGPTFVLRLVRREGATAATVVGSFRTARTVAGESGREQIEALFGKVQADVWQEMMAAESALLATLTRWFVAHSPSGVEADELANLTQAFAQLAEEASGWGSIQQRASRSAHRSRLEAAGVPVAVAARTVAAPQLAHTPDIVEVANATGRSIDHVGSVFYRIGHQVGLDQLMKAVRGMRARDRWQRWALQTIEDDLLAVRRKLAERTLTGSDAQSAEEVVEHFVDLHRDQVTRVAELARTIVAERLADTAPLTVVVRQIQALAGV